MRRLTVVYELGPSFASRLAHVVDTNTGKTLHTETFHGDTDNLDATQAVEDALMRRIAFVEGVRVTQDLLAKIGEEVTP